MPSKRVKPIYQVVELTLPSPLPELTQEVSNAVAALESNPGMEYLLDKLRLRKSYLDTLLRTKKHESLREVDYLQLGVQWCGWLESEIKSEIARRDRVEAARPAFDQEEQEFERIAQAVTIIGQ